MNWQVFTPETRMAASKAKGRRATPRSGAKSQLRAKPLIVQTSKSPPRDDVPAKTTLRVARDIGVETYRQALEQSKLSGRPVRIIVSAKAADRPLIAPLDNAQDASLDDGTDLDRSLAAARLRGRDLVAKIMEGPEMLSADAFAARLGTTRVTVNAWRHKHQVLALEGATRGFRYPDWQIGLDGKPFALLPDLFERLGGSAWAVYRFLVQRHPELGGQTARRALERRREASVLEAAESFSHVALA